jgi:hypothetical protein
MVWLIGIFLFGNLPLNWRHGFASVAAFRPYWVGDDPGPSTRILHDQRWRGAAVEASTRPCLGFQCCTVR